MPGSHRSLWNPRPIKSSPTASCSLASRPRSCRWPSAISSSVFRVLSPDDSGSDMRTIDKRIAPHVKLAASLVSRAPTLTLAYEARCKSRLSATLDNGEAVALVLPRGTVLADGDVLVADDG